MEENERSIGGLVYLANSYRPDISTAVGQLASFNANPKECASAAWLFVLEKSWLDIPKRHNYCSKTSYLTLMLKANQPEISI